MNNNANVTQLLKWMSNVLNIQHNHVEFKSNIVVQTPWSIVIKAESGQNCYYLKQTPLDLFIEPEVINCINKNLFDASTPKVLFKEEKLHCFIMSSCGDYSLRTKFDGNLDSSLLVQGLESYIKIQHTLEDNINDFIKISVPDWRINNFPDLYIELLEKKDLLADEGLTSDEINHLIKLIPEIKSVCKLLAKYKIKDTLVNCDFNENNMIIDEKTQKISIIDWGETVISHPFFSIAAHLHNTARRYQLELKGQALDSIKQKCLSYWLNIAKKEEINEIYQNILRLLPIYLTLSLCRLQSATDNNSKEMQRWFIKGHLQMLLQNKLI